METTITINPAEHRDFAEAVQASILHYRNGAKTALESAKSTIVDAVRRYRPSPIERIWRRMAGFRPEKLEDHQILSHVCGASIRLASNAGIPPEAFKILHHYIAASTGMSAFGIELDIASEIRRAAEGVAITVPLHVMKTMRRLAQTKAEFPV